MYGVDSYISRINLTVVLVEDGRPCVNEIDPDLNDTAKIILCNQTTTRVLLTNKEVHENRNVVRYNSSQFDFICLLNVFILILFSIVNIF